MLHNNKMSISVPFKTQHFSITCSRFRGTTWRGYTLHSKFKTKLAKCVIWHLIFPGRDCDIACVLLATVGWYVGMIKENAVDCYVLRCVQCSVQCTDCTALCTQPVCSSEELSQQRSLVTTWSVLVSVSLSVLSLSWCDVSIAIVSSYWRTVSKHIRSLKGLLIMW